MYSLSAGSSTQIRHLSLKSLLPNTDQYMTYEGSTTYPGCYESTVWIILNKPIYITKQEVSGISSSSCLSEIHSKIHFVSLHVTALRSEETYAGLGADTKGTVRQQCETFAAAAS
jgi:Eukaryotic-type carbonic anhydrase